MRREVSRSLFCSAVLFSVITIFGSPLARPQQPPLGLTNPNPIWGYADVHMHQFANLGFGGLLMWGEPYSPAGISDALPFCDFTTRYAVVGPLGNPLNICAFGGCSLIPVHGPSHTADLIGLAGGQGFKPVGGYPNFDGWPSWSSFDHQQVYIDWLYRAHQGGLQLAVMHAVNNQLLCSISNQQAGFGCDDMDAVDRQLTASKGLQGFLDLQAGGPGKGWYRIVRTPQEARDAIANGQLAVVLGIEVDTLFRCDVTGNCTKNDVSTRLQKYYDLGVRHLFPVHVFNNGFGGAAVYNPLFDLGNKFVTGDWIDAFDCSGVQPFNSNQDTGYQFDLGIFNDIANLFVGSIGTPPHRSGAGQCNARGLTSLGAYLIKQMMARHMVIDIDHMSAVMTDSVLNIAEAQNYPIVSGHTGFVATSLGNKRAEGQKTEAVMTRLKNLGALVAPILDQGDTGEITSRGNSSNIPFLPCSKSDWAWAQAYLYAVNAMGGAPVALGSDFNGGAGEPAPRYGTEGCGGNAAESSLQPASLQLTYPFQLPGISGNFPQFQMSSVKTNDFNFEGLAHVGLLPDMIADLRANGSGLTDKQLEPLFHSAEAYIELWERLQNSESFAPTTSYTVAPQANANGWNNTNVTATLAAAGDPDGSGLASLTYSSSGAESVATTTANAAPSATAVSVPLQVTTEGATNISFYGSDSVGNNSATAQVSVHVDKTPPSVQCASADGQWHGTDVSLACAGSDAISGLQNPADSAFLLSTGVSAGTETNNASTNSHTVLDLAGNSTTAGPIAENMVDKKAPSITIATPTSAVYTVNQVVQANYNCVDGGSGVATCTGTVSTGSNINTTTPGVLTFAVNAADNVSNSSSQSIQYKVSYNICLLYDPTKAKHPGSTYPINIALCDANRVNLSTAAVIVHAVSVTLASTDAPGILADAGNANPDMDFRFDSSSYIFNLKTTELGIGTYNLNFTAGSDPSTHAVQFQIK